MSDPPGTKWLKAAREAPPPSSPHYQAAVRELKLTPQEQYAYQHHLGNLARGGVRQPNGKTSSFLNIVTEMDGRHYVLPTVWDNQIVEPDEAVRRAREGGIDKWPSYDSLDAAEARYDAMHGYMERDTASRQHEPARTGR